MSIFSIGILLCLFGIVFADPLAPYIGINWATDDVSLSLCRSGCQNLCCPVNATLTTQGVNNNYYLYIYMDPQSASKCGATAYTTYSPISTSSVDSSGVKLSATFMGISFNGFIDESNNKEFIYSFPIPGGSGSCILDAPVQTQLLGGVTTTTSDSNFMRGYICLIILSTFLLFLS